MRMSMLIMFMTWVTSLVRRVMSEPVEKRSMLAKENLLNLRVHVAAHVGGHVDRGLGGEVRAAHAAGHHQQRHQNHQQAGDDDVASRCPSSMPASTMLAYMLGQHDLADDLDDHAQRPDDEIQRVGPGVV